MYISYKKGSFIYTFYISDFHHSKTWKTAMNFSINTTLAKLSNDISFRRISAIMCTQRAFSPKRGSLPNPTQLQYNYANQDVLVRKWSQQRRLLAPDVTLRNSVLNYLSWIRRMMKHFMPKLWHTFLSPKWNAFVGIYLPFCLSCYTLRNSKK